MSEQECHEAVTRQGEEQPCDKPAVAMRIDVREGLPYPVCVKHTRKPMVTLATSPAVDVQTVRAEAWALAPGERRTTLTTPERGEPDVNCRTCLEPIEAYARVALHGMSAGYAWRHISDGSESCTPAPRRVQPYDHYDADHRLRARAAVAEGGDPS